MEDLLVIDDGWFQRTEKFLYSFPDTDKKIKKLKARFNSTDRSFKIPSCTAKYGRIGPPSTNPDKLNEIEYSAERRIQHKDELKLKINLIKCREKVINHVFNLLDDDSKTIVQKKYFDNWQLKNNTPLYKELGISKEALTRRKNEIVAVFARHLGELVEI